MLGTRIQKSIFIIMIAALAGTLVFQLGMPYSAGACGWNNSGGEAYTPQRRDKGQFFSRQQKALSENQARRIATNHVTRLNPNLKVGQIVDGGAYYEAEVTNKEKRVVQIVGVDKFSGQLTLIN